MSGSVKFVDQGLGTVIKQVEKIRNVTLSVGVVGAKAQEQHGDSGLTNGELAAIHYFGTEDIPARKFLSVAKHKGQIQIMMSHVAWNVVNGADPTTELSKAGRAIAMIIRNGVKEGETTKPRLSAEMQKRTGRVLALMDSLQLYDAIGFEIINKNVVAVEAESDVEEDTAVEGGGDLSGGESSGDAGAAVVAAGEAGDSGEAEGEGPIGELGAPGGAAPVDEEKK